MLKASITGAVDKSNNLFASIILTLISLVPQHCAAALVIQGSACVYSKKVEYLHSLVYQTLEFVADRKVKALRSKGKAEAGNQDNDEFDDEEHFLSLDDTLEGKQTYLEEKYFD